MSQAKRQGEGAELGPRSRQIDLVSVVDQQEERGAVRDQRDRAHHHQARAIQLQGAIEQGEKVERRHHRGARRRCGNVSHASSK